MKSCLPVWLAVAALGGALLAAPGVLAQQTAPAATPPPDNATCLACHSDTTLVSSAGRPLTVDERKFGDSVHGALGLSCVDCHTDLARTPDIPHAAKLARVDCSTCHDTAVSAYNRSIHAFARRQSETSVAATCADCHTAHEIRPASDPAAGDVQPVPWRPGDHPPGQHPHRQRRGTLPGQHSRPGGEPQRSARLGQLHELSRQPRRAAPVGPGEPRASRERAGHVRDLSRRHQDALRQRRARHGARHRQRPGAGLQ
jgi:hypothetical protein